MNCCNRMSTEHHFLSVSSGHSAAIRLCQVRQLRAISLHHVCSCSQKARSVTVLPQEPIYKTYEAALMFPIGRPSVPGDQSDANGHEAVPFGLVTLAERLDVHLPLANTILAGENSIPRYHDKGCYAANRSLTINELRQHITA